MKKIVVFSSGRGSNLNNIIQYFEDKPLEVSLIVTNNPFSGSIDIAKSNSIPFYLIFDWEDLERQIQEINPDLIVLTGFLLKIPKSFLDKIGCRIINIHPSLLPKYGGKGMYGSKVHKEVLLNRENSTGITIHFVNENYDEGDIIFQSSFDIDYPITLEGLEEKIHRLEYEHLPKVIENLLT